MTNWQTILPGVATALTGLAIIVVAALVPSGGIDATIRSAMILAGFGMVTGGAGIARARADATSVAAHQESLDKIAEAKRQASEKHEVNVKNIEAAHSQHIDNQVKIANLEVQVEKVPDVVAKVVAQEVPQVIAQTLQEPPRPHHPR